MCWFCLGVLKILSCIWLSTLLKFCVQVWLSECILIGVHWVSWILIFFIQIGEFSVISPSNIPLSLSLSLSIHSTILGLLVCFCWSIWWFSSSLRVCQFFFILFSFCFSRLDNINWLTFKFSNSSFYLLQFPVETF